MPFTAQAALDPVSVAQVCARPGAGLQQRAAAAGNIPSLQSPARWCATWRTRCSPTRPSRPGWRRMQLPSSFSRGATQSPGPGSAPAARPACRSLRKQFKVAASPSITSYQTPPETESPPMRQQQPQVDDRALSAAHHAQHTAATLTTAALDQVAAGPAPAHPGSTIAAECTFLGSAGMVLTHGLHARLLAVRGLQSRIWWPVCKCIRQGASVRREWVGGSVGSCVADW